MADDFRMAYVHGVSTRRVDDLVRSLGMTGISKSQVSRLCQTLDAEVERFRTRKREGPSPYVRHEAQHDRVGGRNSPTTCRSMSPKLEAA